MPYGYYTTRDGDIASELRYSLVNPEICSVQRDSIAWIFLGVETSDQFMKHGLLSEKQWIGSEDDAILLRVSA
jgi:hypothetical protein